MGLYGKLREVQRFCEYGGEGVPTTAVEAVELAPEVIDAKRLIAALAERNTEMKSKLVEAHANYILVCNKA